MNISRNEKNRLGIFSFYDKNGKLDQYVEYLLEEVKRILDDLIIVCNGKVSEFAQRKISEYTKHIIIREEVGYEVGAWKKALNDNRHTIQNHYDEIILFDDTFFGPFKSFEEIFKEMENTECDFWGLSLQHESRDLKGIGLNGYIPAHLNTSFVVVRTRLLEDDRFWSYWENIELPIEPNELYSRHQIYFTQYFEKLKYKYSSYSQFQQYDYGKDKNYNLSIYNQYYLISDLKCPVLYKKPFGFSKGEQLRYGLGNDLRLAIGFIENNTNYPIDYIWENIIRIFNNADLFSALELNYILPSKCSIQTTPSKEKRKIAVVMHMFYSELFQYCSEYARAIPDDADVYITTNTDEKCNEIKKIMSPIIGERLTILNCGNRGRDVAALIVTCRKYLMKYDYLCFVHDKKSSHLIPITGACYQDTLWENTLKSKFFVEQVIELFDKEKRLGLLSPPAPYAGAWFGITANTWTSSFEATQQLYNKLNLSVDITSSKRAVSLGTVFWCRPVALKQLFEYPWKYEDFPEEPMGLDATLGHAVERILAFIAQENGYYTGWVMNDEYATLELSNQQGMMELFVKNAVLHQGLNYCEGYMEFLRCLNQRLEIADRSSMSKPTNKIKRMIIRLLPHSIYLKLCKIKYKIELYRENKREK